MCLTWKNRIPIGVRDFVYFPEKSWEGGAGGYLEVVIVLADQFFQVKHINAET